MAKRKTRPKSEASPPKSKPSPAVRSSSAERRPAKKAAYLRKAPRTGPWLVPYAGTVALAAMVLTVWPQGMFFEYSALIVAGLLFLTGGFLFARVDRESWWGIAPWAAAAVGYLIAALAQPLDLGLAQAGAVLHAALVVMALLAWIAAEEEHFGQRWLWAYGGLMAVLAWLIPLDTGHWMHPFSGLLFTDRWASVFQYPDTAGALWGAAWLACTYLGSARLWQQGLARWLQVINGAAFLLALSRGADLIMPFALGLSLVAWGWRGQLGQVIARVVGGGIGSLLLSLLWRGKLPQSSLGPLLFLVLAAAIAAAWLGIEFLYHRYRRRWGARRVNLALGGLAGLAVVVLAAGLATRLHRPVTADSSGYSISTDAPVSGTVEVAASAPVRVSLVAESRYDATTTLKTATVDKAGSVSIPNLPASAAALSVQVTPVHGTAELTTLRVAGPSPRQLLPWFTHVLPASLYTRLLEVNPRQLSIWQRGVFVADGMRMAEARPILGYGAGGWGAGYRQYQSLPYTSREVHDGWVQWWIDGGALAGLAYAAMLAGILYAVWQARGLESAERRRSLAGLVGLNAAIFGHSIVDWDFSFLWVELVAAGSWAAMMRLARPAPVPSAQTERLVAAPAWGAGLGSLGVLVLAGLMAQAQGYTNAASNALQRHDASTALTALKTAVGADANWGSAWQLLAQGEAALVQQKNSGITPQQVSAAFAQALRTEPTNPDLRVAYGQFLAQNGSPAAAADQYLNAVELGPMRLSSLNPAIDGLYNVAVTGLAQSNQSVAKAGLDRLHQAVALYQAKQRSIPAGMLQDLTLPDPSGSERVAFGLEALTTHQPSLAAHWWKTAGSGQSGQAAQEWLTVLQMVQSGKVNPQSGILGTIAHNLMAWQLVGKG